MADRRDDAAVSRPRPRPGPVSDPLDDASAGDAQTATAHLSIELDQVTEHGSDNVSDPRRAHARSTRTPHRSRQLTRIEYSPSGQLAAAAGNAIVTAARVGRLLGRSGWRIAKQLPMVSAVEQQAQRLRQAATTEVLRLLEIPQNVLVGVDDPRLAMLLRDAPEDPEPLRSAMTELLERSGSDTDKSRDYLFGSIVSQLVPDEARILAALATDQSFASVDVVAAKQMTRAARRTVLRNVSSVGSAAGISVPGDVAHNVTRLHNFGLVEFGPAADDLNEQFDLLLGDPAVKAARAGIDEANKGSARCVRRSLSMSPFGREFWRACAPSASAVDERLR